MNENENNGGNPPPDGAGAPSNERLFTPDQVSEIVKTRLAQDRRTRGAASSSSGSGASSPGSLDAAAITRRALAFHGAGYAADEIEAYAADPGFAMPAPPPRGQAPRQLGAPVTGAGAPANPTYMVTEDTPIMRMSDGDRIALRRRIGDAAYVDRMRKEFRQGNVRVRFGR